MREVVCLQIGRCGNQVGGKFWELICDEHSINEEGYASEQGLGERREVYFSENKEQKWIPRAVMCDLESSAIDQIRGGFYGKLFSPDAAVCGMNGAGNNWGKGHYSSGNEIIQPIMDVIQKEVEKTDVFQGFQIMHSLGGGTGSGLGTLVLEKLKEQYTDRIVTTYSIMPSPLVSDTVVEPYNAVLSMHHLIDYSDASFVLDNEALYGICTKSLKLATPTYADLNTLVSAAMSGITCSLRYPGQLNGDMRKMCVNLIPHPRLHFFSTGYAPLCGKGDAQYREPAVSAITRELFEKRNLMCAADLQRGKFLTAYIVYRGKVSTKEVEDSAKEMINNSSHQFIEWIPHNMKTTLCDIPPKGVKVCATIVANSTATSDIFASILNQYNAMFRRRAFLHWYTSEGVDPAEFTESESNLLDLIAEYQQYEIETDDVEDEA